MIIDRNNVFEIIQKASLKPDKDYGQNFLVEPSICENIVRQLDIQENDKVLEIGPGLGSLTHFISEANVDYTVVDIDKRMVDFLNVVYKDNAKLKIIENDIRKVDVSNYDKIIGNLPYNITTELVTYLLCNAKQATKMVLMCQAEAFNRFNDLKGKEYGPISILIYLLGGSKRLLTVKAGSFIPAPKCSSIVFELNLNKDVDRDFALVVYQMTKQLFLNRRKTISNNLTNYLKNKDKSISILNKLDIPLNKRPEELSPEQFKNLYLNLKSVDI